MTIYDRDGNVYRLRGPNPLMKTQQSWDPSRVEVINFEQVEEIPVEAAQIPVPIIEMPAPVTEIPVPEKLPEPVKPQSNLPQAVLDRQVNCLCLPFIDKYLDKVTIKIVIVGESDIQIKFWTQRQIGLKSILYPQNTAKRWWKVTECVEKSGGFLITGVVSDVSPDLS